MSEFMNYLAMQKFIDSNWKELKISNYKQEHGQGVEIHVSGQVFGLLGATALAVNNLAKNNNIPIEVAFDFMNGVISSMNSGAFSSQVQDLEDNDDVQELINMFRKNKEVKGE